MHKDIEHTKMYNAYAELIPKVQALITEHVEQHRLLYGAYAIRELAIELSSRHLISIPAVVPDEKHEAAVDEFFSTIIDHASELFKQASENVKRKEK